jgi:uncharacterized membrane protein
MENQQQDPAAESGEPDLKLVAVRGVPAANGVSWLGTGFDLFKKSAGNWVVITILFFIIMIVLSAIPILSIVASLLSPVFVGGIILGCRTLDSGRELEINHLFAGFKAHTSQLIGLGAINILAMLLLLIIVFVVMMIMGFGNMMEMEQAQPNPQQMMAMLLAFLVMLLVAVPIAMLFWFAPVILVLNDEIGIFESMKYSFQGCLKNIMPFLLYGIVAFILAIIASIPLMLGWLVLMPVVFGSMYAAYKDIYTAASA